MRDKLQEIIKDAQEDTYSDSPRFVDAILALLAPVVEKARKWDIIEKRFPWLINDIVDRIVNEDRDASV